MSRLAKNVFIDKYLLLFLRIFKVSNIDKSTKKLYFLNYTVLNFCSIFPSFAFCLYDTILKYYVHGVWSSTCTRRTFPSQGRVLYLICLPQVPKGHLRSYCTPMQWSYFFIPVLYLTNCDSRSISDLNFNLIYPKVGYMYDINMISLQ